MGGPFIGSGGEAVMPTERGPCAHCRMNLLRLGALVLAALVVYQAPSAPAQVDGDASARCGAARLRSAHCPAARLRSALRRAAFRPGFCRPAPPAHRGAAAA